MGRDKAGLIIDGRPLWQHQLETLRGVEPREFFISGKPEGPYAGAGLPVILDDEPGLGPLAGIAAALRHAQHPLLLVLAIDLSAMTCEFLRRLVRQAGIAGTGVVPHSIDGFEPLAAIYPRTCLPLAEECLRGSDHSLQNFVRQAIARGLVAEHALTPEELSLFRNLNDPGDLERTPNAGWGRAGE
jgi:molybdopterin-guanine dinucleotide biosynthesis protein A